MVTFKHKNTKKFLINTAKTTTLDNKHNEFVKEFNNNNSNKIPLLIIKRDTLKKKIQHRSKRRIFIGGGNARLKGRY